MLDFLTTLAPILTNILLVAGMVGGALIFANMRKMAVIEIQEKTVKALQDQITAIKDQQLAQIKENERLKYILETIEAALKQKGIMISIEGELVTITDAGGKRSSSMRKRPPATDKTASAS